MLAHFLLPGVAAGRCCPRPLFFSHPFLLTTFWGGPRRPMPALAPAVTGCAALGSPGRGAGAGCVGVRCGWVGSSACGVCGCGRWLRWGALWRCGRRAGVVWGVGPRPGSPGSVFQGGVLWSVFIFVLLLVRRWGVGRLPGRCVPLAMRFRGSRCRRRFGLSRWRRPLLGGGRRGLAWRCACAGAGGWPGWCRCRWCASGGFGGVHRVPVAGGGGVAPGGRGGRRGAGQRAEWGHRLRLRR